MIFGRLDVEEGVLSGFGAPEFDDCNFDAAHPKDTTSKNAELKASEIRITLRMQ
jgi:hypothetical protein